MNCVLSSAEKSGDVVFGPLSSIAEAARRARRQSALLSLGRRDLTGMQATALEYEVVSLVAKTIDATLCAIVTVQPQKFPLAVDKVVCMPVEAVQSGPSHGDSLAEDGLLQEVLEDSCRLIVGDVQTNVRYVKTWCYRQGIRSAIAIPLELHGEHLGALVVGHANENSYNEDDLLFLECVGSILAAHLARAEAELAIRAEQEYLAAMFDNSSAMTLILDARGVITRANRVSLMLAGLRSDQVVGQPFWLCLCMATEAKLAETSFAQLSLDASTVEFESTLLTSDGYKRFVGWRMCYVVDPRQRTPVIMVTGVDISRQRRAEQDVRQAMMAAETARRLVDELRAAQSQEKKPTERDYGSPTYDQPSYTASIAHGRDRRTSERKLFPYRQQIAPFENGIVPPRCTFQMVRCWDISAGGISFLLDEPPQSKSLVVVLGGGAGEVLMSVDVVRVAELEENGVVGHLVGCRFTGKL